MQKTEIQYILKRLRKEIRLFIDTVRQIPYVALPSEKPEVICFAKKIKELSGYDADEILTDREHWANIIYPDDRQRVFAAYTECKNWGVSFEVGYRIIHKDGSLRYVMDKGEPIFGYRGDIIHVEGMIAAIGWSEKTKSISVSDVPEVILFSDGNLSILQEV